MITWGRGEAIVKQLIASTIPDSLFMKVRNKGTAGEIWKSFAADFEQKLRSVSVNLRRRLQDERCGERGDVCAHFIKIRTMTEDLAAMGHIPDNDDLYAIVLSSLPQSYDNYTSAISATSTVLGRTLTAEDLMKAVEEEYDRRVLSTKGGRKDDAKDAVFWAKDGKPKGKSKKEKECFNCHKKGHFKSDCWAPGGGKEGQGPRDKGKKKESAAAAKDGKSLEDAAWLAIDIATVAEADEHRGLSTAEEDEAFLRLEADSMPDLDTVSDSSVSNMEGDIPDLLTVSDSSSEVGSAPERFEQTSDDDFGTDGTVPIDDQAFTLTFEAAYLAKDGAGNAGRGIETALYDSGATRHMSPY